MVFDTTYNTNKYSMIFAPFVGVNNLGQTTLFACGLMSDESTESFVWLLTKFLEAIQNTAPQIIITDQDTAIAKAISMVMPLTFHRCQKFEFEGYPCRYMISYLKKKQVLLLPDKYILPRWTKNAKEKVVFSDEGSSSTSLMAHHGMLAHKSSLMVDDTALTDTRTIFLMGEFEKLHIRVKDLDDGGNVAMSRSKSKSQEESQTIHDPSIVQAKGCRKRVKSSKEKSLSKTNRQCSTCQIWICISQKALTMPTAQDEEIDDIAFVSSASSQCDVVNWFL
ncbi:Protein FAR1-RELATED SEQUENCE [Abeliophyllum distichum]|uniref:Protein FAR1-RELATED SEQUENCE n=1 Tax=Abeliophyllum distichum TaxID=126358 RepID=A0ABD1QGK4_9LAMI